MAKLKTKKVSRHTLTLTTIELIAIKVALLNKSSYSNSYLFTARNNILKILEDTKKK